jgi:hypothetical protein
MPQWMQAPDLQSCFFAALLDICTKLDDKARVPSKRDSKTAATVRHRVEQGGERLWRLQDFQDLPFAAVAQALSRMARAGELRRLSRGVYFRARQTAFGKSLPNPADLQELAATKAPIFPAGIAGASLLGFTTQTPRHAEVATTANSLPKALLGKHTIVHTRRPAAWSKLDREDAALLDFLRRSGRTSELSPAETARRSLELLAVKGRLARLVGVAATEPPRVRAMLGALAELAGADASTLQRLRRSLHPLSRFDFGMLAALSTADAWQAKPAA